MPFGPGGKPSHISNQKRRMQKNYAVPHKPGVRSQLERDRDMAVESEMYRQGHNVHEIAKRFNVSATQIYRDINKMRKIWREEIARNIDELRAEEIAKLRLLEREANAAWQRSTEDRVQIETTRRVAEAIAGKNPLAKKRGTGVLTSPPRKTSTEVMKREGQAGDPRFQMVILKCIELRGQLLGLTKAPEEEVPDGIKTQDEVRTILADRIRQLGAPAAAPKQQDEAEPPVDIQATEVIN